MREEVEQDAEAPPGPPKKRRMSMRRKIVFIALPSLLFAGALFAVELYVRLTRERLAELEAFVLDREPGLDERIPGVQVFEGDARTAWKFKPYIHTGHWDYTTFSTNAQGWRHPRDFERKAPGGLRIVCIGDSVTFGYRVPTTFPDTFTQFDKTHVPFSAVMEQRLRARHPKRSIDVISTGVPGFTSHQGLAFYRGWALRLDADIVTICFGYNDTDLRAEPDSASIEISWPHVARRRLVGMSQALMYASKAYAERRAERMESTAGPSEPGKTGRVARVSEVEYVGNILEIARIARERGATPIVIAPIFRDRFSLPVQTAAIAAYRRALEAACEREKVIYLEIEELTEERYPGNAPLFGETIHPNWRGHRLIAERLLEMIDKNGIIEDSRR